MRLVRDPEPGHRRPEVLAPSHDPEPIRARDVAGYRKRDFCASLEEWRTKAGHLVHETRKD